MYFLDYEQVNVLEVCVFKMFLSFSPIFHILTFFDVIYFDI